MLDKPAINMQGGETAARRGNEPVPMGYTRAGRPRGRHRCDFHLRLAGFRRFVWRCQVMPMTRVDRAASTTSSVMVLSSLICMMRSICVNSLSTRRKLPRVIRAIAARA